MDRRSGQVDVTLAVEEGPQVGDRRLRVEGNRRPATAWCASSWRSRRHSRWICRRSAGRAAISTTPGRSRWWTSRANPWPRSTNGNPVAAQANGETMPVRVNVQLREVQPIQLAVRRLVRHRARPGRHPGRGQPQLAGQGARARTAAAVTTRGCGRAALYLSQPSLHYWPVETNGIAVLPRGAQRRKRADRSVQRRPLAASPSSRRRELGNAYVWSYGYRYERARKFATVAGRRRRGHRGVAADQHVHARDARRGARCDPGFVHLTRHSRTRRVAGRRLVLPEVLRPVLPLLPAAAGAPEALHQRGAAPAVRVRHRRASGPGARTGRTRAGNRALLCRWQHDAARLRAERRRPGRRGSTSRRAARRCWC